MTEVKGAPASTTAPAVAPAAMLPRTTRHVGASVSTTYLGLLALTVEGAARALSAQHRGKSTGLIFSVKGNKDQLASTKLGFKGQEY